MSLFSAWPYCQPARRWTRRSSGGPDARRGSREQLAADAVVVARRGRRSTGSRAAHVAGSTSTSSHAGLGVEADDVAVAHPASGPPSAASGVTWIAAGTLPEAPDMRPSVTSATLKPGPAARPAPASACAAPACRWPCGPWKRTTATKSRSSSPRLEGGLQLVLVVEHDAPAPRSTRCSGFDRRDLDHRAAEIAGAAASGRRRAGRARPTGAQHVGVAARRRAVRARPARRPSRNGSLAVAASPPSPATVSTSACSRPASSSSRIRKPMPPAAWKWFTSAVPFG